MFVKVLVSEDIDSINLAIQLTLFQMMITDMQHVKYCDDAVLRVKKALHDGEPFDLFITDLSFEPDSREVKLTSGEQAIQEIKKIQPDIKILVYSVEDKPHRIKSLYSDYHINAFVHKSRNSVEQLKKAIVAIYNSDEPYFAPELKHLMVDRNNHQIDQLDIQILQFLAAGNTQDEIANSFKAMQIVPSSKSAIEKKVNKLKDHFRANNTIHLIAIAKDLGII